MRGDSNEVVVQGELLGFGKKPGQQEQQLDHPGREGLDEAFIQADENQQHQDPVKKSRVEGQKLSEGGMVDMQILENGGGDLPSFSIKRLRMLPLRGGTGNNHQHQQSVATADLDSKPEPNGNDVVRSNENGYGENDNEKENEKEEKVVVEGKGEELPAAAADENAERKGDKPCEEASGEAPAISDNGVVGISSEEGVVQSLDSASKNKQQQIEDDGCSALDDTSPGVNNEEEVVNRQSVESIPNGVTASDISSGVPGLDRQPLHELTREGQTGEDLGKEFSVQQLLVSYQTFSEFMSCEKVPAGGGGMQVKDKDHHQEEKENVDAPSDDTTPKAVDDVSSVMMKTDGEPEQKKLEGTFSSTPTSTEGELPDSQQPDVALTSAEHEKPVGVSTPGCVQILPAVLGNKFGSPEETTDEDDSPRSSLGFANPEGDPNFLPLPYSGQIMYPGHYSNSQSPTGPSLLQYSGSMSLRSDSSTTSNRSFAFPILAPPEWNSSPVRMAKADPRYLRRRRRWDGCCFFRLGRSRYKY